MNRKRIVFIFFFFLIWVFSIFPEKIVFKYQKGVKYRIVVTADTDMYVNDQYDHSIKTLYKASVDVVDTKDKSGYLSAIYRTSEKGATNDTVYRQTEDEIAVGHWRNELGAYTSAGEQLLPQIRDIPLFPDRELAPGDSWEAEGKMVMNLADYGLDKRLIIPLDVSYVYIKNETIKGVKCAVFRIYYTFSLNLAPYTKYNALIPLKTTGYTNQSYAFDIKNGREFSYEDTFRTMDLFASGDILEFKGKSNGEVIEGTPLKKDEIIKELEDVIKKEGIKDTTVQKDADGVKIILEDINFLPDSDVLLPAEQEKLKKIGEVLKKYPERDFFIGGHTALAGTEAGRQHLSEMRARAVGEFLLNQGVCGDTQLTIKGFGARIPLGDNSTPEGMKKNRRVEIKILEN